MTGWKPLAGITIVDLTRMLPGGTATLLLADLGARVIKIETLSGDETRYLSPRVGTQSSAQHQYMDRGKESIRLDLKQPAAREQVLDLCRDADAVVEGFRPGVANRLGLGFAAVKAVKADIVYVSISGYGATGPRADFAGHDLNFLSLAGLVDRPTQTLQADVGAGMLAALGLLAGVSAVRAGGEGAHLDLSLFDAALVMGGMQVSERLAAQSLGEPVVTPLDGNSPCYQLYRCADGRQICVAAIEPKFFARTVEILGHPEWSTRQQDSSLIGELAAVFATRDQAQWVKLLDAADTCVTPVADTTDLRLDPHVLARQSLVRNQSAVGPLWQVAPALRRVLEQQAVSR